MASSGIQPGFEDAPAFSVEGALDDGPDQEELARYAVHRGNLLKGSTTQRQAWSAAYPTVAGVHWSDLTDSALYRSDGAGGWTPVVTPSTAWQELARSTGWTAVAGHTPRARLLNGVVWIEGAALRGSGGSLSHIATIQDSALWPSKTTFIGASVASKSGESSRSSELYVTSSGVVQVGGYTTIDTLAGWSVPLSGAYVLD